MGTPRIDSIAALPANKGTLFVPENVKQESGVRLQFPASVGPLLIAAWKVPLEGVKPIKEPIAATSPIADHPLRFPVSNPPLTIEIESANTADENAKIPNTHVHATNFTLVLLAS